MGLLYNSGVFYIFSHKFAKISNRVIVLSMLAKTKKSKVIKENQTHKDDTGSPEVQVALLTKRIVELTKHLKKNKKDKHSRRGLLAMVADRRGHLAYLSKKNPKRYNSLTKKLDLKR